MFDYVKLDYEVEITSHADRRLNCRADQDVHRVRVDNWRALRLSAPTSRHFTRDGSREYPQGIQHAVDRYRRLRARVLVELEGGHGVNRGQCQKCEQADERISRRTASLSAKCPGK